MPSLENWEDPRWCTNFHHPCGLSTYYMAIQLTPSQQVTCMSIHLGGKGILHLRSGWNLVLSGIPSAPDIWRERREGGRGREREREGGRGREREREGGRGMEGGGRERERGREREGGREGGEREGGREGERGRETERKRERQTQTQTETERSKYRYLADISSIIIHHSFTLIKHWCPICPLKGKEGEEEGGRGRGSEGGRGSERGRGREGENMVQA